MKKRVIMNNIGKKVIILGIILFVISISLTINTGYLEVSAGIKSKEVLSIIKETRLPIETQKEMPVININGYDYIGTIAIPKINIELPVMSEYDQKSLNIAPNRYYGSLYTNDLIICGHSYKTHFRYLNELIKGDNIIFIDLNNIKYVYEVIEIEILGPYDIDKMINNEYDLTLYTCTTDGLKRLTIRCNRIKK